MEYLAIFLFFFGMVANTFLALFFTLCLLLARFQNAKYRRAVNMTRVPSEKVMYLVMSLTLFEFSGSVYVEESMSITVSGVFKILAGFTLLLGLVALSKYRSMKWLCEHSNGVDPTR